MKIITRLMSILLFLSVLTGCVSASGDSCPVTEPIWIKPPEDSAVGNSPVEGNYFVNEDHSIWASAWWTEQGENYLHIDEDGIKVGWFRPEGAEMQITGKRIDAQAPPLESYIPCCYPTRFQATGLYFPTEGCWEVTARAEDSVLSFIVQVEP
ncbi:MAG TPA: hypothetical protein VJ987_11845 [Anaerolineales bacterium]|nr:hypothetical protein [Anaerolineales bacterium]